MEKKTTPSVCICVCVLHLTVLFPSPFFSFLSPLEPRGPLFPSGARQTPVFPGWGIYAKAIAHKRVWWKTRLPDFSERPVGERARGMKAAPRAVGEQSSRFSALRLALWDAREEFAGNSNGDISRSEYLGIFFRYFSVFFEGLASWGLEALRRVCWER